MGHRKMSWMEAESLAKRRKEWRSLVHGLYPPYRVIQGKKKKKNTAADILAKNHSKYNH